MRIEIEWLDRAKSDLRSILNFIAQEKPIAAQAYVDEIASSVSRLHDFPELGKRINSKYRTLIVRKHIVFYRYSLSNSRIVIAAVVDGRRDLSKILPGLK